MDKIITKFKHKKHIKYSRNKGIVLYALLKPDPIKMKQLPENATQREKMAACDMLAVTATPQQLIQARDKFIYLNHIEHFSLWCAAHDLIPSFRERSWEKYKLDVIGTKGFKEEASEYITMSLSYSTNDVAAILRALYKCRPLLMDYETPIELHKYLERQLDPETHLLSIPIYLFSLMQYDAVDGKVLEQVFKLLQAFTPTNPTKEDIEDLDDLAKK